MAVQMKSATTASTPTKPASVDSRIGMLPSTKISKSIAKNWISANASIITIALGKAITSRDNQDVRHIAAARQARSG